MTDNRYDGITNALTALGGASDKHMYNRASRPRLFDDQQLDWMYESGRFASTIIDRIPDDCTRKPVEVTTNSHAGALFAEEFERFGVRTQFNMAHKWGRLVGGAGILMVVDDGLPLSAPMDLTRVNDLIALHVFDSSELYVRQWYTNVRHPQYGEHKMYNLTPALSPGNTAVHASRVLPFYGRRVRRMRVDRYDYWGQPELERVWQSLSDIETSSGAIATAMHNASFFKLKLKDLKTLLTGPDTNSLDSSRFVQRLNAIRMSMSIINALTIDADMEDIEPVEMNLKGLVEGYGVSQQNLAFITGIPLSLLFGIHPNGFSNNDETGLENYRQTIGSEQSLHYTPNFKKLLQVLTHAKLGPTGGEVIADLNVQYKALDEIKPTQRVELESKMIDSATKLIDKKVISPEDERKRLAASTFTERWVLQDVDTDQDRKVAIEALREKRTAQTEINDAEAHSGLEVGLSMDAALKYTIPSSAQGNAKKVNKWLREKPGFKGGTATGKARMRQLGAGGKISKSDLVEINAWFARHKGNEVVAPEHKDEPWKDAGYTSFLMWGGQTMREYAASVVDGFKGDADDVEYSGAIIALYPSDEVVELAQDLIGPDVDTHLHCTLVYMPEFDRHHLGRVKEVMRYVASTHGPIGLAINGEGVFNNPTEWVHVLNPSGLGLNELRADLCKSLDQADVLGPQNHDFIPHITLGYYEPGELPQPYGKALKIQWPHWTCERLKLVSNGQLLFECMFSS